MDGHLCKRCGADLTVLGHTTSWFDGATVCIQCSADESHCPNYQKARDAECDAVRAGDFNFKGIGLAPADERTLRRMREDRGKVDVERLR